MNGHTRRFFPTWMDGVGAVLLGVLALGVRFAVLGRDPLAPDEARLALEALAWTQGRARALVSVPLYPWWTGLLFFLFEPGNFWARWWPAVLGSTLVLLPWWLFPETPRRYKVLLSMALALDPALVQASRTADGATWALSWWLFALGAVSQRRWTLALILGLLGFYGGWLGWWSALVLLVALGLWVRLHGRVWRGTRRVALGPVVAGAWVLFMGLGLYRAGLAGLFQGLVEGTRRLMSPEWPTGMALWPFLAYQGPLLVLWLVVTFVGLRREEPEPVAMAAWVGWTGALLWWLYPGRRPDLAIWVNLGLWPGVIWGVMSLRLQKRGRRDMAWLLTGFHLALWVLAWSQVALLLQEVGLGTGALLLWRGALLLLALFLIGLSFMTWTTLLPAGQVRDHALAAFLLVLLLGQASGWARVLGPASQRLWQREVASSQLRALQTTWAQWALWTYGHPEELEGWITVSPQEWPEVRWALRHVRRARWLQAPPRKPDIPPEVVVTLKPKGEGRDVLPPAPSLPFDSPVPYRAQDFIVREEARPFAGGFQQGLLWLLHLQPVSLRTDAVLFWLRTDRFLQP